MSHAIGLMVAMLSVPNPVLPGAADVGVLRFNGAYYLMGVGTDGAVHASRDLIVWSDPVHVFSMDNEWAEGEAGEDREIHACDLILLNGRFHLYWSVNLGDLRQIGHAVSDAVLGPYVEPNRKEPLAGRIDPHVFRDEDGQCYFYRVSFAQGNVIHGQPFPDPHDIEEDPSVMLTALPDTWEWRDDGGAAAGGPRVNEAPCVTRHQDRYYLLYNANHTWERYGNYAIGVAEAGRPLEFSDSNKYPFPILHDSQERILARDRALAPLSLEEPQTWRHTESEPDGEWAAPGFDDASWKTGQAGFGNQDMFMMGGVLRTHWQSDVLWLRRTFEGASDAPRTEGVYYLLVNHDGPCALYLNGMPVAALDGFVTGYRVVPLPGEVARTIQPSGNVLAARIRHDGQGAQYFDAGLFHTAHPQPEPIVANCGQPNVVRGPNGFEWWAVYFALTNGNPVRAQHVDRVLFLGDELYVDGPTVAETPGHHPAPSPPTFFDAFGGEGPLGAPWELRGGSWRLERGEWRRANGEARQLGREGMVAAGLRAEPARQYLFEAGMRYLDEEEGWQAGLIVWEGGPGHAAYVGIDRCTGEWFYAEREEYNIRKVSHPLPADFRYTGWHAWRVLRDGARVWVWLDGVALHEESPFALHSEAPGWPGLITRDTAAAFGGVVYTKGWEEWGADIHGWGDSLSGAPASGAWSTDETGLMVQPGKPLARVFKGDPLGTYEFSTRLLPVASDAGSGDDAKVHAGILAVYVDEENYVRAMVDPRFETMTIEGVRGGLAISPRQVPVRLRAPRRYPVGEQGLGLRVRRYPERLVFFADGIEVASVPGNWPPSQVGLAANGGVWRFDDMVRFDLGSAQ